jgi:4-amino-4-deoxy-L-arabinose transferase-like glycosyltransferase
MAHRPWLRLLPVLLPLAIFVGTGIRGLDFGQHWDERHYQIAPVQAMIRSGQPLPGYYGYPALDYWISASAVIPDAVVEMARGPGARERVLARIDTHAFLLRLRAVFLGVCALTVLWVYLLVLEWRKSVLEALLAALLLATSWEVAYHSRWIATDGILMQFGALTMLLVMRSHRPLAGEHWLWLAAVAAGLGAGTKYPGALLLLPVTAAGWLRWRARLPLPVVLARLAGLCATGLAAFVITNPVVVLAPSSMLDGIASEIRHYRGGHYGHTVHPGIGHLRRIVTYLGLALFSWFRPIALFLASLCVIGIWALRKEPRTALLLLCFPVVYILYFSLQSALLVRNFLVVAPFLAILAARGVAALNPPAASSGRASLRGRVAGSARLGLAALLVAAIAVDAGWLWHAASTIRQRKTAVFAREAVAYVRGRPGTTFYLSPRVRAHFAVLGADGLPNVTGDPSRAAHAVFYAHEGTRRFQDWRANRLGLTERWFGPYEVNFNIYPNWWGDDRIVVMSMAKARSLRLLVASAAPR